MTLVWPQRQRCKRCRNYWPEPIILGLYCSYLCAAITPPPERPEDAPRECRYRTPDGWAWKRRYATADEVPARNRNEQGAEIYQCSCCHLWHLGHRRKLSVVADTTAS